LSLSQLPFAIALIRTWKVPDRAGLALAMGAGVTVLLYLWDQSARSPWLSASFGLATVVFAYLVWRHSLSRKGDVGVLISKTHTSCKIRYMPEKSPLISSAEKNANLG
jgi:hypothetical protein